MWLPRAAPGLNVGGSIGGVALTCIKRVGQEREFGLKSREQDRKKVKREKGKERHLLLLGVRGKKRWSSVLQDRKGNRQGSGWANGTGQDRTGQDRDRTGQVRTGQDRSGCLVWNNLEWNITYA
jgi:hypothetical protein